MLNTDVYYRRNWIHEKFSVPGHVGRLFYRSPGHGVTANTLPPVLICKISHLITVITLNESTEGYISPLFRCISDTGTDHCTSE